MKCKYCNADIEQDAQFCTNCGKDLSKFERCVKCGELLDRDTVFCPYCGTEQSKKVEVKEQNEQQDFSQESQREVVDDTQRLDEEKSSKKWVWIFLSLILLATIIGGGYYFYDMNNGNKKFAAESDSTKNEVVDSTRIDPDAAKEFIESLYKDYYDPNERADKFLNKYFTEEAMQKFYVESDYDEGTFFYCTNFLVNGSISGDASPDYGDKVVSRTIKLESDDWFLVTNIWDVIKKPVKVHLQVKSVDGAYKIVNIDVADNDERTENTTGEEEESVQSIRKGISIEQLRAVSISEAMQKQGYKKVTIAGHAGAETDIWFVNCTIGNRGEIKTKSDNACIVEAFDGMGASVRITVFDKNEYEQIKSEVLKYSVKSDSGYCFKWDDNEEPTNTVINMGVSEWREGGFYIDIPLY